MQAVVLIAIGGAMGSVGRYYASRLIMELGGGIFPIGTMFVNVTGSMLIGFLAALSSPESRLFMSPQARMFLITGICGGYTTFSTFSLETFALVRDGQWAAASLNAAGSVILCIVAVWLGAAAANLVGRGA